MLRKTFAVEVFIKREELTAAYERAIQLPQVSYETKKDLYDAFDRKQIFVPYPSYTGKKRKN